MTPAPVISSPYPSRERRLQRSALAGIALAFGGVYWSLLLQGGAASDLLQWSSVALLLLGTAGAVLVTTPLQLIQEALGAALRLFATETADPRATISLMTALTKKVKKDGIVALEQELPSLHAPLLHQAARMASDGCPVADVTGMMRLQIQVTSRRLDRQARVFEAAAGYAPTLGILGAVLGLMQVMKHLDQMAAVGHGIAGAFVSTVYGLALANLVLLPVAGRLRASGTQWVETQELFTEGMTCLMERLHPLMVESRLAPFLVNPADRANEPDARRRDLWPVAVARKA